MRTLFLALALAVIPVVSQAAELVKLTSDKPAYSFGEKAILSAELATKPDNANMEFDLVGLINGFEMPLNRVSDYQFLTQAPGLFPGTFYWVVHAYLQDARLAHDLKTSMQVFNDRIVAIDAQLATETDPAVIAALQAEKSEKQDLLTACRNQLAAIRTEVWSGYITFTIN